MAGQEFKGTSSHREESDAGDPAAPVPGAGSGQVTEATQGVDDLLDEIDGVLESNAEEFVRGFVQKGGQ